MNPASSKSTKRNLPGQPVAASRALMRRLAALHADSRGSMSIVSVFTLLMLVMLLGLVLNMGRQVNRKVQAQNAADAAAYSSGVVLARSMNSLAFTNHLLCDVFALTIALREVQQTDPPVSPARLAWLRSLASALLPRLEPILADEQYSRYQRDLIAATPSVAITAADGIAQEHGLAWPRAIPARGMLWSAGGPTHDLALMLPAIDPTGAVTPSDESVLAKAQRERRNYARQYLREWNRELLGRSFFSRPGQQWHRRAERRLARALRDNALMNLPVLVRRVPMPTDLERNFSFVGIVYSARPANRLPGIFSAATPPSQQAYAEVRLFIPRNRLFRDDSRWPFVFRQSSRVNPGTWDLWNQNWTVQLCPATTPALPELLSAAPPLPGEVPQVSASWRQIDPKHVRWLSHH